MVPRGGWREIKREFVVTVNGYEVYSGGVENVLELDSVHSCTML